jgi:hypothetical protein
MILSLWNVKSQSRYFWKLRGQAGLVMGRLIDPNSKFVRLFVRAETFRDENPTPRQRRLVSSVLLYRRQHGLMVLGGVGPLGTGRGPRLTSPHPKIAPPRSRPPVPSARGRSPAFWRRQRRIRDRGRTIE